MKRNSDRRSENTIVFSYLRTYLIVLIIPLIICSLYCGRVISILERDDTLQAVEKLRYSETSVDTLLEEAEGVGSMILNNVAVQNFTGKADALQYPNTYSIIELQRTLPDISYTNENIYGYFIFFDQSQLVINRNIAYTYPDFYELYFHEQQYDTYEEWLQNKTGMNRQYGILASREYLFGQAGITEEMMTYDVPLPSYSFEDNSLVRVCIRKAAVEALMPTLAEDTAQMIQNDQGKLLYCEGMIDAQETEELLAASGREKDYDGVHCKYIRYQGEQYLLLSATSERTGLTYSFLQPSLVVRVRGLQTVLYMVLLILFAGLVGIILSIRMSYKTAQPINELLKEVLVNDNEVNGNTMFSHLHNSYRRLMTANSELQTAMEEQKPFLQEVFSYQLLYGNIGLDDDIYKNADYVQFAYRDKVFWVLLFRGRTEQLPEGLLQAHNLYTIVLTELIRKFLPDRQVITAGEDKVIVIMELPKEQRAEYHRQSEALVQKLGQELPEALADGIGVYGGTVAEDLAQISISYENAMLMQLYQEKDGSRNIIWYEKQKQVNTYPTEEKCRALLHQVLKGDVENVYQTFADVIEEYFIQGSLNPYLQNLLLDELQINLVRIMDILRVSDNEYQGFCQRLERNHNDDMLERIRITRNLYLELGQKVYERKNGKVVELSAVIAYLNLHYADQDLSLTSTAEAMQVSEGYLSTLFKQETGVKFSSYVEQLRMEQAKQLLSTTSMTIREITQRTGYTSENSFCRAFKRVTGMSTTEWKTQEK